MKIGIIGAGISGLSAAYELTKLGHKVIVFERSDTPGGLGTYIKIKNNYIERFYHHFFESDNYIKEYAKELEISKKLKFYKAKTGIFYDGKIYSFRSPLDVLNFKPLSFWDRLRCGAIVGFLKLLPTPLESLDKIPASEWIKKYAGKNVYEKIWGPLLEGKFSEYANKIPALWLWGRIKDRSSKLGYFDISVKVLFDKIIESINKSGNMIKLNSEIIGVSKSSNGIQVAEKNSKYSFEKVILTTVSPISNFLIKSAVPDKFRKYLNSIDHLGAVCLVLELKYSIQSQYWLNICDKKSPVLVMIEHTNMLDKKYYGESHIVYLANYIHRNDKRFKDSAERIFEEYTSILSKLNKKFNKSWILKWYISKVPRAQTIFGLESLKNIPPITLPIPNLYMINIDQMYPHDRNLNQGIELGKKVTKMITAFQ